ncbi:uncharacterized protein LOC130905112 [Corythoichthys intestinalis]|uniref:uncharacterized protein LOC130905112 n=1 Tax=Corythoichthys intestinalis TaxID=161448 RepID=UPI0025A61B78|nr:uncharacterized protein LOC130905112 [Corythoichthys intestinalis]
MDTDFTQDSVLHFLQSRGGSVKNADLLLHFKGFLRDHADQVRNRELFKKFVNSVATVKQEHGVSHVVLRKKYRTPGPSGGGSATSGTSARGSAGPPPPKATLNPAWSKEKVRQKPLLREETTPTKPRESDMKNILPVAGIILNNNNVETNLNLRLEPKQVSRAEVTTALTHAPISVKTQTSPPEYPVMRQSHLQVGQRKASIQHGEISKQVSPQGTLKSNQQPIGSLHQNPNILGNLHVQPRSARQRQSYKTAVSYDDDDEDEEPKLKLTPTGAVGPLDSHLRAPAASSMSQPIAFPSTEIPTIYVQNVTKDGQVHHSRPGWSSESVIQLGRPKTGLNAVPESPPEGLVPTRRSLPVGHAMPSQDRAEEEERRYSQPVGFAVENRQVWSPSEKTCLSSSHNSIFTHPSDAGFPGSEWPAMPAGSNSSTEKLHFVAGDPMDAFKTQQVLQQPRYLRVAEPWHHSTGDLLDKRASAHVPTLHHSSDHLNQPSDTQWRHSAGNLYDDHESSDCSGSSPAQRPRPTLARRISSKLKGRMCRSMGADLDRFLQEEAEEGARGNEAARRKRLHRISSSLSLHYNLSSSSLSSGNSLADLAEADAKGKHFPHATGAHHESPHRQSQVPLEAREHAWLVKGASGAWPDIYSLFREDATLLNRRDFISGFTVLHWIAKHGDHRVLNTLWYGVQKAGVAFDINAKASCGQTPLHVAAIHGNKNIIRLLVNKFNADVKLRDTAGKKPWQYLSPSESQEVFRLLGAPARDAAGGRGGSPATEGHGGEKPRQRRRHKRHHLSFAWQGERPRTVTGSKVKRSTSIAAFLKHKPLVRFHGYKSDG